jgi:hypothetical protein
LALFNGTGGTAVDFDKRKDFIGRLSFNKSLLNENLKTGLGFSYYNGGYDNQLTSHYNFSSATGFSSSANDTLALSKRDYKGIDVQLAYDWRLGLSTLKGEYIFGSQAGTSSSSKSVTAAPSGATYNRNFMGYYVCYTQNILQTKSQLVVKYDVYDPNTDISGKEIGTLSKTGKADIAYSTLGLGWIYRFDSNVKFTLYYDMVSNESTSVKAYAKDLKDNVLTVRVQYKF